MSKSSKEKFQDIIALILTHWLAFKNLFMHRRADYNKWALQQITHDNRRVPTYHHSLAYNNIYQRTSITDKQTDCYRSTSSIVLVSFWQKMQPCSHCKAVGFCSSAHYLYDIHLDYLHCETAACAALRASSTRLPAGDSPDWSPAPPRSPAPAETSSLSSLSPSTCSQSSSSSERWHIAQRELRVTVESNLWVNIRSDNNGNNNNYKILTALCTITIKTKQ